MTGLPKKLSRQLLARSFAARKSADIIAVQENN